MGDADEPPRKKRKQWSADDDKRQEARMSKRRAKYKDWGEDKYGGSSAYNYKNRLFSDAKKTFERGDDIDYDKVKVIGTSTALEKDYFRLTREPLPSEIRTEETCARVLEFLLDRWEDEQNY